MTHTIFFDDLNPEVQVEIKNKIQSRLKKQLPEVDEITLDEIVERNMNQVYEITI